MPEIRRDKKGRKLKDGESQRNDGRYQYRYTDINGERRYLYDWELESLRAKEKEINIQLSQGVSFFSGKAPLSELLERLFALKCRWKESTRRTMVQNLGIIKKSSLYNKPINRIKMIECKDYVVSLHNEGYSFGTVETVFIILKEAFTLACESDLIVKNPCGFKLKSLVEDDTPKVEALTAEQEKSLFEFLHTNTYGRRMLDLFTVLIGTGLRISEFAALTIKDIDFENNVVTVDKQLYRQIGGMKITSLKSESSNRKIPMADEVRAAFVSMIERRKAVKLDVMIDGYVGFLSVTRNGRPRGHSEYADAVRVLMERYNEQPGVVPIERCTPHTLRHTFCTKCVAAGMDIKTVQYLMGHSDASTTLNIYTDVVEDKVAPNMESLKIIRYGT